MTLAPATLSVWSNLVHTLLYSDDVSAEEVLVWHRRFDKVVGFTSADAAPTTVLQQRPAPAATSRLRVGFLSPDFRRHPVGDFTDQLFEHHDRSQIEVVCYHDSVVDDDVSARLAAHVSRWVKTSGLNDDELVARIAGDGLDVLIDLAGHTGLRLRLLARRLAPVQATWLGYPATTGLSAIDYRLTDARADPPAHDALNSERLVRLPHSYFCYRPRDVTPLPGPLPALARDGEVTFGSFNIVAKISATTLDLWASVLRAVPRSRLLLKATALAYSSVRDRLRAELGARGIDAERIEFREWVIARTPRGLRRSRHRPRHGAIQRRDDDLRSPVDGRSRGHRGRRPITGADGREHPHCCRLHRLDRDRWGRLRRDRRTPRRRPRRAAEHPRRSPREAQRITAAGRKGVRTRLRASPAYDREPPHPAARRPGRVVGQPREWSCCN